VAETGRRRQRGIGDSIGETYGVADQQSLAEARAAAERVEQVVRDSQAQIDAFVQADVGSFYALAAMREHTLLGLIGELAGAMKRIAV
jgi:hypothetical protein